MMIKNLLFILTFTFSFNCIASSNVDDTPNIILSNSIPVERKEILEKVFKRIENLEFDSKTLSPNFKKLFGENKSDLIKFLKKRIKYIIDESDPIASHPIFVRPNAANMGAALYYRNRKEGDKKNTITLNGETIEVDSPQFGMVQLYESFFKEQAIIIQVSTLLHEARHSDCESSTKCNFRHSTDNSDQIDRDLSSLGAYAVEYYFAEAIVNSCLNCDQDEIWQGMIVRENGRKRLKEGDTDDHDHLEPCLDQKNILSTAEGPVQKLYSQVVPALLQHQIGPSEAN